MTTLSCKYTIVSGKHRLLEPINDICIATDAISVASHFHSGLRIPTSGYVAIECNQFPLDVQLPLSGPVACAMKGLLPVSIEVDFQPTPPKTPVYTHKSGGFKSVHLSLYAATFVNLFEQNVSFLEAAYTTDRSAWPDFWNFVRVVRNCCSHGGTLNFTNPRAAAVNWYHMSYDPTQNGHLVIGGDLSFGDLLVLMVEMSEELDALGAPL